jgi:hypothetical protein
MYDLLVAGAATGPGEIAPATEGFVGDAGFRTRVREQLTEEFGCDPLSTADDVDALIFGKESEEALRSLFPDGGEGAAYGESHDELRAGCGSKRMSSSSSPSSARATADEDSWIHDVYKGKDEL